VDGSKRNPDWTREETALALELYLRRRPNLPSDTDPAVIDLSNLLQLYAKQRGVKGTASFRNPAGVSMKIANLSRLDNTTSKEGLPHGSKTESQVWAEFGTNQEELRRFVDYINASVRSGASYSSTSEFDSVALLPRACRIWVTGMWGYTPEIHGYVGFTTKGARDRYLHNCQSGDLMMIIGQNGETADPRDVGRLLYIVELDPTPMDERDCMSPKAYAEKVARFGPDRWRYAMPVLRAWRVGREIRASYIAPETCSSRNARALGANCKLLTNQEASQVLKLPVTPCRVWGQPDWAADIEPSREIKLDTAVSRGPVPTFGSVIYDRADRETKLYVLRLEGCVQALFPHRSLYNQAVVKIGRSNDVLRRLEEINCGFPPGANLTWQIYSTQTFVKGEEAHDAEQRLLKDLERRRYAIGKEYAIVPERELGTLLASVAEQSAFIIRAK
jgi:hypothetical protein